MTSLKIAAVMVVAFLLMAALIIALMGIGIEIPWVVRFVMGWIIATAVWVIADKETL